MPSLTLQNAYMRVVVDTDFGAQITHFMTADETNLLFYQPWRTPIPASRGLSYGNDALDWLSHYRGGWQELFPNAGAGCTVMGTPLPFHGEVSTARWDWEWLAEGKSLRLTVPSRLPLVLERTLTVDPDKPVLHIREIVRNESSLAVPYIWGHHPAFGPPLTAAGARIDLPGGQVVADSGLDGPTVDVEPGTTSRWPNGIGRKGESVDLSMIPAGPTQRLCYISELDAGWFAIRNPDRRLGFAMAWDPATFPAVWLWQEIEGGTGLPWYGRAQITAIEPASQWPAHGLAAAQEAGNAHLLQPASSYETELICAIFEAGPEPVQNVSLAGEVTTA